jgi:hypothetical protein
LDEVFGRDNYEKLQELKKDRSFWVRAHEAIEKTAEVSAQESSDNLLFDEGNEELLQLCARRITGVPVTDSREIDRRIQDHGRARH